MIELLIIQCGCFSNFWAVLQHLGRIALMELTDTLTNCLRGNWLCRNHVFKMGYLYRSDALVPQGKANVEKDHW